MPQVIVTMGRGRTAEQRCAPREAIVDSIHGPIGAPRASTRVRSAEGGHTDLPAGTAVPTDERARLAAEWVPA